MIKYIILTLFLISCNPGGSVSGNVIIGNVDNFKEKYKFHYGFLENETNRGWQLDIVLESDSIVGVLLNKRKMYMYDIIDSKVFILYGKEGDSYTVIEVTLMNLKGGMK